MINLGEVAMTYGEDTVRGYAQKHWVGVAEYLYAGNWTTSMGGFFHCPLNQYRVPPDEVIKFQADFNKVERQLEQQNIEARLRFLEQQHVKDQRMIQVQRQMLGLLVQP